MKITVLIILMVILHLEWYEPHRLAEQQIKRDCAFLLCIVHCLRDNRIQRQSLESYEKRVHQALMPRSMNIKMSYFSIRLTNSVNETHCLVWIQMQVILNIHRWYATVYLYWSFPSSLASPPVVLSNPLSTSLPCGLTMAFPMRLSCNAHGACPPNPKTSKTKNINSLQGFHR